MSDNNTTSSNNNTTFFTIPSGGSYVKSAMDLMPPFSIYVTSTAGNRAIEVTSDFVGWDVPSVTSETTSTLTAGIDYRIRAYRITGTQGDKGGTL